MKGEGLKNRVAVGDFCVRASFLIADRELSLKGKNLLVVLTFSNLRARLNLRDVRVRAYPHKSHDATSHIDTS